MRKEKRHWCARLGLSALLCGAACASLYSQGHASDWGWKGSLFLHADGYFTNGRPSGSLDYRRPPFLLRAHFQSLVMVGKFSMPNEVTLTLPGGLSNGTGSSVGGLGGYLLAPGNRLAIHPGWRTFRVHLGTQNLQLSPLTAGDIQLATGLGFEFCPKSLRIQFAYGVQQGSLLPGSNPSIVVFPRRNAMLLKVGLGDVSKTHLHLNIAHYKEHRLRNGLPVGEGFQTSLDFKLRPIPFLQVGGELALAVHDSDAGLPNIPSVGAAARVAAGITRRRGEPIVEAALNYVGPSYHNMGWLYMVPGHLDVTGKVRMQSRRRWFWLHARGGLRNNFVPGLSLPQFASNYLIADMDAGLRLRRRVGMDAAYSNMGWWDEPSLVCDQIRILNRYARVEPYVLLGRTRNIRIGGHLRGDDYAEMAWVLPQSGTLVEGQSFEAFHRGLEFRQLGRNKGVTYLGLNLMNYVTYGSRSLGDSYTIRTWCMGFDRKFLHQRLEITAKFLVSNAKPGNWPVPVDRRLFQLGMRGRFFPGTMISLDTDLRQQALPTGLFFQAYLRSSLQYQF